MPPALAVLALVAIAVPASLRGLLGRPRLVVAATIASLVGVLLAQVAGDALRSTFGVVGDAQVGLAIVTSLLASAIVMIVERGDV